jgi:NADH-quinone oxidoreductase subunit G
MTDARAWVTDHGSRFTDLSMPKLIIDEHEVEVPKGTRVIEAAERLGIKIPRFCYHEALGAVGACRLCAVTFLEGPVKGVQMSCMTDARDGMVVSTTHPEAVAFRRSVIEWLMLNHPHDCPVCDEGGHCLLQDMTVAGGHGIRRYEGTKRTFRDQYLGPFVQHEMNRCIHCWRCRRFYQEHAGYRDLGAMQIGSRTYFGRFREGPLESPFAGNLIDLCPTGVYTDRPARFKGRRWDFQRAPSVCLHCSLGCNTTASARYREVMRVEGRVNRDVNGHFLCDRGRFAYGYANHAERPREARVDGSEVPWAEGVEEAAKRLGEIAGRHGPQAVAGLGSPRSSFEAQGTLHRLSRLQDWSPARYFADPGEERRVKAAVAGLDAASVRSLKDLEAADAVLVLGADPLSEAPLLALSLRQAWRKGARVAVLDPRPVELPFDFEHFPVRPSALARCLGAVVRGTVERKEAQDAGPDALRFYDALPEGSEESELAERLAGLGRRLRESERPVLVCGTSSVPDEIPALAASSAALLRGGAGLFFLLPGPNAFGAALWSPDEPGSGWLEAIEERRVKALVLVESDPFWSYPDRARLEAALDRLECLVVLDHLPSHALKKAHVALPTTTVFEAEPWTLVNQEGRVQRSEPVHAGGTPISQVSAGAHPPRVFRRTIPGGDPRPAWEALAVLSRALGQELRPSDLWVWLGEHRPELAAVLEGAAPGTRLIPEGRPGSTPFESHAQASGGGSTTLEPVLADMLYGSEELAAYSDLLRGVEGPPRLVLGAAEASRRGLTDGDRVAAVLPAGNVSAELRVRHGVAEGVLVIPRHRALAWQRLGTGPIRALEIERDT